MSFPAMKKALCVAVAIAAIATGATIARADSFARIGTSSVGGGFYLIGNTIAQLGNSAKNGISYSAVTGGSAKNAISLAKGDIEFGMIQSATIDEAWNGKGTFKSPIKSLRFVTAIYPMPCHVLANGKDIKSIADFKGKNIDYGAIGAGIETYCRIILGAYNINDSDVKIDRYGKSESVEAIQNGSVQGNFWTTTVPNAQVTEMLTKNVRLLPIDSAQRKKILAENKFFSASVIKGGSYDGYPKDIPTIAAVGVLVTDEKVSEEVVYKTLKAMYGNTKFLKQRLPNYFADFSLETALNGNSIELHPGAKKYFKEAGVLK